MKWFIKTVVTFLIVILTLVVGGIAYSFYVSEPLYNSKLNPLQLKSLTIASPKEALTFARAKVDGEIIVVLVTKYKNNELSGINLSHAYPGLLSDPIDIFNQLGYELLQQLSIDKKNKIIIVGLNELLIPIDTKMDNIGIGGNYIEHVQEAGLETQPVFVFPKKVLPTLFNTTLSVTDHGRLDYEVELGIVPLRPLTKNDPSPKHLGFILCNDFTDRLTLVKEIDQQLPLGVTGFARAKGKAGFLPVGNLFVIPKNYNRFLKEVELKLYVNGNLRQYEFSANMIKHPADILKIIFDNSEQVFYSGDEKIDLINKTEVPNIPKGTIILSGTPAGVVFKLANVLNPMVYLQEGDNVAIHVNYLGVIVNEIL